MNYNKYNPRCNSGTKWSCGDDGDVGQDDGDDDPDEARGDDDGNDFPLRAGITPQLKYQTIKYYSDIIPLLATRLLSCPQELNELLTRHHMDHDER